MTDKSLPLSRITEIFDRLSPVFCNEVGGPVHLVRVMGVRWSYVAGHVPEELPFVEPQKVMLDEEWAIVYYPQAGQKIDHDRVRHLFADARGSGDDAG